MAVDTARKRRAISGIPGPSSIPGVTPTAAKNALWRYETGWAYSGFESVVEPQGGIVITFQVEITTAIFGPEVTIRVFLPDDTDVRVLS